MKNQFILAILVASALFGTSCSTIHGIFGKTASKEQKKADEIALVEKSQGQNTDAKIKQVAVLASGIDYSLLKITNREPAVSVAQEINRRVESLSGKPDLEAEKEMWKIVDDLLSQNVALKSEGKTELEKKDKEIGSIQQETKNLAAQKDADINKFVKLSEATAQKADVLKSELDDYKGFFGLKAVAKGLFQFIKTSAWFLVGGSVIFIILRFASMANPVAASIFGVLENIASWGIHVISTLFPKALSLAGTVSKNVYNDSQVLLKKIVDNIQNLKQLQTKLGHNLTLEELFTELSASLSPSEKTVVDNLKKELGY